MDRPEAPLLAMRLLAALAVAVLVASAAESAWFGVHAEGKYTEGIAREPGFTADYVIGAEEEVVNVKIFNATPLINYWLIRDEVPNNETEIAEEEDEEWGDSEFDLDSSRRIMGVLFASMVAIQALAIILPQMRKGPMQAIWLLGLLGFIIVVPAGIISGIGNPTGGLNDDTESEEFAHFEFHGDMNLMLNGIEFEFLTEGYDLGLIPHENHSQVIDSAPEQDSEFADSYIVFEGTFSIEYDDALTVWMTIPLVWLAMWLSAMLYENRPSNEEE